VQLEQHAYTQSTKAAAPILLSASAKWLLYTLQNIDIIYLKYNCKELLTQNLSKENCSDRMASV
jgi:hypothetical protein